jgi:6-phosphogluconolactonase
MAQHAFPSGEALARNLANDVAAALERRLAAHGAASLVVSGGRTPTAFLRELGSRELDWSSVFVTLADERRVTADDPASNVRFLREAFAGAPASVATLVAVDATGARDDAATIRRGHPWHG